MMISKKILYYTQVYYLDIAVEYVKLLTRHGYDVSVLIELSETRLKSNILHLDIELYKYKTLTSFWEVSKIWKLEYLEEYFCDCKSVEFVIYKKSKNIKELIHISQSVLKYINNINPDFLHFDDISPRQIGLLFQMFHFKNRCIVNIHDPKPHLGEFEWKRYILKKILFLWVKKIVVFSEFSRKEVFQYLGGDKNIYSLKLMPYTIYKKFLPIDKTFPESLTRTITFIGRLSPYKGIELFVEAISMIVRVLPNAKFVIAGKSVLNYELIIPHELKNYIYYKNAHLSNSELATIVGRSQLVVCPYIEATQSGVIMTAIALNCPVLVTEVGGLAEYINNGFNGVILNEISSRALADSIIDYIQCNSYDKMQPYFNREDSNVSMFEHNIKVLNELYD